MNTYIHTAPIRQSSEALAAKEMTFESLSFFSVLELAGISENGSAPTVQNTTTHFQNIMQIYCWTCHCSFSV